jgi:trypsin-like peptidase
MRDSVSPAHRTWLIRGAIAIGAIGAVAMWLAMRGDVPPATPPGSQTQAGVRGATVSDIAEAARRATVLIVATNRRGEGIRQGTGFFLSADGLLATNFHVIEGAQALQVQALDGTPLAQVYLVATDSARDLAILRVSRSDGPFLRVAARQYPAVGDPVYVMGNPLGQVGTFSTGVVSATRDLRSRELVQITAPISPGSSGGPVLNSAGEVIGVATSNLRDGQNMNFAVSARYLPPMMAEKDNAVVFTEAMRVASEAQESHHRVATQTASATTGTPSGNPAVEIERQFVVGDSVFLSAGYVVDSRILWDYLEEGKANQHAVNVKDAGTYLIQAYCDIDCSRLAISLRDSAGQILDGDQGADDRPALVFIAESPGRYVMRISMLSCSISPCAYGVRLYRWTPSPSH